MASTMLTLGVSSRPEISTRVATSLRGRFCSIFAISPFEVGRAGDELVQPMTLMFRMVEFERLRGISREAPRPVARVHGLWDLVRRASAAGELALAREDILFFGTPHEHELSVNSTRVTGVLA